jgi:peptidylprolyl isomerase
VFVRKLPAILATAGLLISLTACTSVPPLADCTPAGNALLVKASGPAGGDPAATFPTPLVAKSVEVADIVKGDGDAVGPDDAVAVSTSVYDGKSGSPLNTQQGPLIAAGLLSFVNGQFPFTSAMSCTTVGSRFVITGSASDLFGPDSLGLDPATTLVVVSDITAGFPGQADGVDQLPQSGFPSVVFTPRGQPGFTFPAAVPTELGVAALKQGRGVTVKEGDNVFANVTGIVWGAKSTFASSWDNQAPTPILAQKLGADGSGVVSGLATAIIGQQVGTRLLVVVPPSDGYPAGQEPSGVTAGDTLVFVVDILEVK